MKRSISGIIRSELIVIESLKFNGYDLGAILQYLQQKHDMFELSSNTLIVSLYRARKKHLQLGIQTKDLAREMNITLDIPKKTPKKENIKNAKDIKESSLKNQNQVSNQIESQDNNQNTEANNNQPKLLIKQVRDIFKSKTDISDLL